MDVFVQRDDLDNVFDILDEAGFKTELTFSHWLGKVYYDDFFIDIIFNSGNGLCEVDDLWFKHAVPGRVFGFPVKFCPPEEMIWSKAFVMERERLRRWRHCSFVTQMGPAAGLASLGKPL
jgi:hypothetical protein